MIVRALMLAAGLSGVFPGLLWAAMAHCTGGPERRGVVTATVSAPRPAPTNLKKVTKPDWHKEKVTFFDVTFEETNGVEVTLTGMEAKTLKAGGHGGASQQDMQAAWGTTTIPAHGTLRAADQWFISPIHPETHVRIFQGLDAHCHPVAVTIKVQEP